MYISQHSQRRGGWFGRTGASRSDLRGIHRFIEEHLSNRRNYDDHKEEFAEGGYKQVIVSTVASWIYHHQKRATGLLINNFREVMTVSPPLTRKWVVRYLRETSLDLPSQRYSDIVSFVEANAKTVLTVLLNLGSFYRGIANTVVYWLAATMIDFYPDLEALVNDKIARQNFPKKTDPLKSRAWKRYRQTLVNKLIELEAEDHFPDDLRDDLEVTIFQDFEQQVGDETGVELSEANVYLLNQLVSDVIKEYKRQKWPTLFEEKETVMSRRRFAAKRRELEEPEDEYYWKDISPFWEKVIELIAQKNLKGLTSHFLRSAPADFDGNFGSDFEWITEVIEGDYEDPRLLKKKSKWEWVLREDIWKFLEQAEWKLAKAWNDREAKKTRKDPDYLFFKVLTELFTGTVHPKDMEYVGYKPYKNYVKLEDFDGHLGNMDATTSNSSLLSFMKQEGIKNPTVALFIDFLERRGAQLLKKRKPVKYRPPLYD